MREAFPLVEELVPAPDPLEACGQMADLPYLVFLDSAMTDAPLGQHSFLMADPATLVRSKGVLTQRRTPASEAWMRVDGDPLTVVRELLAPFASDSIPGLPPFQGGAAGYLGYDWGAMLERAPRPKYDDLDIPDVVLGIYDWVITWDHRTNRAWLVSTGMPEMGPARSERAARRRCIREGPASGRAGRREGGRRAHCKTRPPALPPVRPNVSGARHPRCRPSRAPLELHAAKGTCRPSPG